MPMPMSMALQLFTKNTRNLWLFLLLLCINN